MEQRTGIAKNLLTERLEHLVAQGIFKKAPAKIGDKRLEYRLTEKGLALLPMMVALHQWSEKWLSNGTVAGKLIDTGSDSEITALVPRNSLDEPVNLHQVKIVFDRGE